MGGEPGVQGLDVSREIRQSPSHSSIYVCSPNNLDLCGLIGCERRPGNQWTSCEFASDSDCVYF